MLGRGTAEFGEDASLSFISLRRMEGLIEDASLSFISLRRMEGLIVLHDKGFLIMVSIR